MFRRKFLRQVTSTAVFIQVLLFPPMHIKILIYTIKTNPNQEIAENFHFITEIETEIDLPVREGVDCFADDEPLSAVADKAFEGADEEEEGGGEAVGGEAGKEAKGFA